MANLGVKAVWSSSNKLAVHAFSPFSNNVQEQISCFDSKILEFSENHIVFDAVLSELINCSCSIFLSIQTLNESEPKEYLKELLNLSIQYRSVIRTCLDLLQEKYSVFILGKSCFKVVYLILLKKKIGSEKL